MIAERQIIGSPDASNADVTTDAALAHLKTAFSDEPPLGYVTGKTQMRNAIAESTGCSLLRAEAALESLEREGKVIYLGDHFSPERLQQCWQFAG